MVNESNSNKKNKILNLLKKPIILSGFIYITFYLWFIILSFIQNFSISLYEILSNVKVHLNENIKYDVTYFLSISLAILLTNIIYVKNYKERLNKGHIFKISFYLALIDLFNIKIGENFAIPFSDWNTANLIINDFIGLTLNFLGAIAILLVSNKMGYFLKDFPFNKLFKKILKEVYVITLIIILTIISMWAKHLKHYF